MRDEVARALAARALEVAKNAKAQKGDKGEKGDPGQIIVQPNKGDQGERGSMGPQGIPGKTITGPKGDKGDKGDTGQKGEKGNKGDKGDKGDKGETGERGFQGLKGLDGSKGDIGPMPKHEKKGLMIRFEKEPGVWGEWIIMPTGGGGGGGRDDKLTDRQKELIEIVDLYKSGNLSGNGDVVGPASSTDNAVARFDTTTGKLIQNSGVTIDDNSNITANALDDGYLNTAASGTLITLTSASVRRYTITGSGGQTIKLPNATTLLNGAIFEFDNNQSSGAITVNNNSNTLVVSVPSGGIVRVNLLSNSIAAGSWDRHDLTPANVSWSTNTLDYAGSITSATWNGNTVAVNRGGTGVTTSTGSGSNVLNTSPTLITPAITGGTIDNTVIGGTTPAAGTVTTFAVAGGLQNLFLQSQTFGVTPTWAAGGASQLTINQTATTAPDSTSTGNSLIPTAVSSIHRISQAVTTTAGVTYTISVYAKANGYNYLFFNCANIGTRATFNISTGVVTTTTDGTATITSAGSGWYRCVITGTAAATATGATLYLQVNNTQTGTSDDTFTGDGTSGIYLWGAQLETSPTVHAYQVTTTAASSANPKISLSGGGSIGLESTGSLYVQPAGTGALQAQATTSSATGGNARGANAVDWQTVRSTAAQVASGTQSIIGGGANNTAASGTIAGGFGNTIGATSGAFIGGGTTNSIGAYPSYYAAIVGGQSNTANGWGNFIGAGFGNSGTSGSTATTQATTIAVSAGTTFYLTATNANIKVGQLVAGTGVTNGTYATSTVTTGTAAVMNTSTISGTTLTVGTLASGTIIAGMVLTGTGVTAGTYIVSGSASTWTVSTSQTVSSTTITGTAYTFTISQNATTAAGVTLSFYTPHGIVVGGGNNQATGSYSFIGGGGDAGTAAQRNTASGDWSVVVGGYSNTAAARQSMILGGFANNITAGADNASIFGGAGCSINAQGTNSIAGGSTCQANNYSTLAIGGRQNIASGGGSTVIGGTRGTTRGILGMVTFSASYFPIADVSGINQTSILVLARQTTDATATVLASDSNTASTTNQVILPNNSAYAFTANVISTAQFNLATTATAGAAGTATITFAAQTVAPFIVGQTIVVAGVTPTGYNGTYTVTACTTTTVQYANATTGAQTVAGTVAATSLTKAWKLEGCIMRTSAAAGTRLVGSVTSTVIATDTGTAAWTAVAAADTTNGGLKITFTGAAATTIRTVAQVSTVEVTY
jgi:hypothetical protein